MDLSSSDSFSAPRPGSPGSLAGSSLDDDASTRFVRPARSGEGDESRTRRFDQLLVVAARRLGEVNALHQVTLESQREAMGRFQDAQQELLESFQRAQASTIVELRRVQEEFAERAGEALVRARVSLVGACGALAASCILLVVSARPMTGTSPSSASTTTPPPAAEAPGEPGTTAAPAVATAKPTLTSSAPVVVAGR